MLRITLITSLLLLLSFSAHAELSIAGGVDVWKAPGDVYGELRYTGEDWNHWSLYTGTDGSVGGDVFITYKRFIFGLGAEYAFSYDPEVVDTDWGYQFRIEYKINENWSGFFKHVSNCRKICKDGKMLDFLPHGDQDTTNHGFNYLGLRYSF